MLEVKPTIERSLSTTTGILDSTGSAKTFKVVINYYIFIQSLWNSVGLVDGWECKTSEIAMCVCLNKSKCTARSNGSVQTCDYVTQIE